jgi:hypothetical protein
LYSTGESLILTLVQNCTNFNANNTSRANWKILNSGKSRCYAILKPGKDTEITWLTANAYQTKWSTTIEVWVRYIDDGTTQAYLYDRVGDIFAGLAGYMRLNDSGNNIQNATIRKMGEPESMYKKNSVEWMRWTVYVEWTEINIVTIVP